MSAVKYRTERELIEHLAKVKFELEIITAQKTKLEEEFKNLKYIVANMLMDMDAKTTTKFEIGSVSLLKPLVRAEIDKNREEEVFDFVRKVGEPEIIKLSIHPQSLYGFVGRCIDSGLALPDSITSWFEPSIRCNFKRPKESAVPTGEAIYA